MALVEDGALLGSRQLDMGNSGLQAGWHSFTSTKRSGIENSLSVVPDILQDLLTVFEDTKTSIPSIFEYFVPLFIGELSFGTMTLLNEERTLLKQLCKANDVAHLHQALVLLWSCRTRLEDEERREFVSEVLGLLGRVSGIGVADQVFALAALSMVDEEDKAAIKGIRRKLRALQKAHPSELKRVLPQAKPGFRKRRRA